MHLIVGLGNPGKQYAGHRHNIGAMALEKIARQNSFPPAKSKFKGLFTQGTIGSHRVGLLFPQTFMNNSGDSVQAAVKFFKLSPGDITVIYDELDLNPGKVRVKTGGGNGGHNGLRSIDPQIGREYQRVRLGIGHPGHKAQVSRHVLSNFHKIDREWLDPLLDAIATNAHMLIEENPSGFMNKMALAVQKADEEILAQEEKSAPQKSTRQRSSKAATDNVSSIKNIEQGPLAGMLKKLFNKD